MKGSFAVLIVTVALLSGGCSETLSPAGPSSVGPVSPSLDPAAPASASRHTSVSSHPAQAVPFRGRFAGTQSLTPLEPPFGAVAGSARGHGTHLGLFTVEFPHTVNFATRIGVGTYTFTAADGDTLTASFTGQAQGGPIVSIEEHATVTGGTGRFAVATGSFVVQRQFDQLSGTTQGSFEGTIGAPGDP